MSGELDTGVCFGSCVSRAVVHDEDPIDEVRDRADRRGYKRLFVVRRPANGGAVPSYIAPALSAIPWGA